MSAQQVSRREALRSMLGWGLGAAGACSGVATWAQAVTPAAGPESGPADRSANAPSAPVAIARCATYDLARVTERLDHLFREIGGIGKLVNGKTVAIKVNLTGMLGSPCLGLPPELTYQTHFHTVLATADLLRRAGARRIRFVESIYGHLPLAEIIRRAKWDWQALQAAGGNVSFEDTHNLGSYRQYARVKVPWGGSVFPAYDLNRAYEETDVFVSLAKLKNHATAGVTLAIKNSFGITPNSLYGDDAGSEEAKQSRGRILHMGTTDPPAGVPGELRKDTPRVPTWRVPRVTVDMLGIRPIDLAIIEGIETISGGEGPWNAGISALKPGLLFAGFNAVCTDAIATAAMGHDPQAKAGTKPFPGDNHLELAARLGLGTHDPARIEIRGLPLKEAVFPFTGPARFQ